MEQILKTVCVDKKKIEIIYCEPGFAYGYTNDAYLPEEIDLSMDKLHKEKIDD